MTFIYNMILIYILFCFWTIWDYRPFHYVHLLLVSLRHSIFPQPSQLLLQPNLNLFKTFTCQNIIYFSMAPNSESNEFSIFSDHIKILKWTRPHKTEVQHTANCSDTEHQTEHKCYCANSIQHKSSLWLLQEFQCLKH